MPHEILIIAPTPSAEPVAEALRSELGATVDIAPHRRAGLAALRRGEFSVVLLEESLAELDRQGTDVLYQNSGAASVLELNFTLNRAPRIVRQVRSTLAHRAQDEAKARAAAVVALENELGGCLTGLLLESELALQEATPAQEPKLQRLVELAGDLRKRLSV
ncbi:MAG: hypothetical protein M3R43_10630 [Acidobacteriota bacterium]|nr:hypothetical protein [Acidobacteriota bacterium]